MNKTKRIEYIFQLKREKEIQRMNRYADFVEARLLIVGEKIGICKIDKEITKSPRKETLPTEFDSA
jgi:hypothetical protein